MTNQEREHYQEFGRAFTRGVTVELARCIIIGAFIIIALGFIRNILNAGVDDSDASAWQRSGLKVYRDAKTGIEYLSDGNGGLVVRGGGE